MSGLDEVVTKLIPISDALFKGKIPEYWAAKDKEGEVLCWLQQKRLGKKVRYGKDLIISWPYAKKWNKDSFQNIVGVYSINPYGLFITDAVFVVKVVDEMCRLYNRGEFTTN